MMSVDENLMVSFQIIKPTDIRQKFQFGGGTNKFTKSSDIFKNKW